MQPDHLYYPASVTAMVCCSSLLTLPLCHLQGGLPANSSTRQFAQELLDRLPGKSGSNGRAPAAAPSQRAQDAAAHALLRQSAQYSLLIDDDDDEEDGAAPEMPAPTTAPLPKKREKKLRKDKAGVCCKFDKSSVMLRSLAQTIMCVILVNSLGLNM